MSKKNRRNWLITGATGFIGRELLYTLLTNTRDTITILSRKSSDFERARVERILLGIDPMLAVDWRRIQFFRIRLGSKNLGLTSASFAEFAQYDNHFIHLAASTRFTNPIDKARSTNVTGTINAFALASEMQHLNIAIRFHYVSTAYVHGYRTGVVNVNDPLKPDQTRNTYEQSKAEAESWIRKNMQCLPTTIFRPSIVIGHSDTGRAYGTPTIYWAVKMALMGHKRFFARPAARLDMVPVDYVVSAILALAERKESVGQCFPIVAGVEKDQTLNHLAVSVESALSIPKPIFYRPAIPLHFAGAIRFAASLANQQKFADQMLAYLPYFSENPRFDDEPTATALKDSGITVPEFDDYIGTLLRWFADREVQKSAAASMAAA